MAGLLAAAKNSSDIKGATATPRLNADPTAYADSYSQQYFQSVASQLGTTVPQLVSYMQQHPDWAPGKQIEAGAFQAKVAGLEPDSLADKLLQKVSLGVSVGALTAGFGAVAGPAISAAAGGGTAGVVASGAASGAFSATAGDVLTQGTIKPKDVAVGALGGAAAPVTNAVGSELNQATGIGSTLSKGIVGAGVGATL